MEDKQTPPSDWFGRNFSSIVMVLLVCIMFVLAGLWYTERQRRLDADKQLHDVSSAKLMVEMELKANQAAVAQLGALTSQPAPAATKDEQEPRVVTVDGQPRQGKEISAAVGKRLGFKPGDVVLVAPASTSQPATH